MKDVVIVDSVRTGLAKSFRGSFNDTRSDDMAAFLIDSLIDRNPQFDPGEVDDIILGAANQSGEQSGNLARMASFLSKLPIQATGTTVNRFCASGLQTIAMAANQIGSGYTDVMMAGGAESISMRLRQEQGAFQQNALLLNNKPEVYMEMGNTAEVVARRYQVTRDAQDDYALQSQQRY
ncbi:acetyl-CoA C-acyltransferase, partial [Luminiphilus sp.]|nr:acetyl-CoA C-acyltransferase [Luminiphilus sp.]